MSLKTVKHEIFDQKKWKRQFLLKFLRKKGFRKKLFQSDFFYEQIKATSPIEQKGLESLFPKTEVHLENFFSRNGNLTPYELIAIATIVKNRRPKRILEIGTFDGNTTLQMALNSPKEAILYTIDLPKGELSTKAPVLESDLQFMSDVKKEERKFLSSRVSQKIRQHFGDSTAIDFTKFTEEGALDFIFIDGGHSEQCVKSDTENALTVLGAKGAVLWHDYTPHFGGVYAYLQSLSKTLPLVHIEGTNLVMYSR